MSASSSRAHKLTVLGYPGTQNEYRILEQIGGGAHAIISKAFCDINSNDVAIKIIYLDQSFRILR
jgi:hypothetical protein